MCYSFLMQIRSSATFEKPTDFDFLMTPLWGHVIYPASLTLLTAPPKAGKSSVLFSWAGCVSQGQAWGGIAPARPLKILYWDLENPEAIQYSKVAPFRNDNLWVVERGWEDADFDISKVPGILEKLGWFPDVIIIDPFVFANASTKENDAKEMARAIRKYIKFARVTKRAVILCHHDRKPPDGQPDNPRWSGRGSSAIPGAVDVQMNIVFTRHRQRLLQVTFSRYGSDADHEPAWILDYNQETHVATGQPTIL